MLTLFAIVVVVVAVAVGVFLFIRNNPKTVDKIDKTIDVLKGKDTK